MFRIRGSSFHFKSLNENGDSIVNDLICSQSGHFYTLEQLQELYNIRCNFLQYRSFINSITCCINNFHLNPLPIVKLSLPQQPLGVAVLTKDKKGCRDIYTLLLGKLTHTKSQRKWSELNLAQNQWKYIYSLPFKITKDSKLQWMQYRINHRITGTNSL